MLELYVWGPAFSLPSIDPQCLAAIAFCSQAIPRDEWTVIACCDVSRSPTFELPALKHDETRVGGFNDIVAYVRQISGGQWSIGDELTKQQKADVVAYSSYLNLHAQPLLDLSLYVSTENFSQVVRPLYSRILPFPLAYTIPPSIRSAAKKRAEHLGFSSLDVDTDEQPAPNDASNIIPENLRIPKVTVSSLLNQTPEAASTIKLDALATGFFEPIGDAKRDGRYLVGHQPSVLDCLAFGYLSLMLLPDLPQPWLATTMQKRYPHLCDYVRDMRALFIGGNVDLKEAFPPSEEDPRWEHVSKSSLPWGRSDQRGLAEIGSLFGSTLLDHIPLLSDVQRSLRSATDASELKEVGEESTATSSENLVTLGSSIVGFATILGFAVWQGLISMPGKNTADPASQTGLGAYGEAGEALSIFAHQMDREMERKLAHD